MSTKKNLYFNFYLFAEKLRILKTKEMKALTNKRVASLPEVVARKQQELEEKRRRGNRILRDVFNLVSSTNANKPMFPQQAGRNFFSKIFF